jgi:hypothetical protein
MVLRSPYAEVFSYTATQRFQNLIMDLEQIVKKLIQ